MLKAGAGALNMDAHKALDPNPQKENKQGTE